MHTMSGGRKKLNCALKSLKNYLKPVEKYVLETCEETGHEL